MRQSFHRQLSSEFCVDIDISSRQRQHTREHRLPCNRVSRIRMQIQVIRRQLQAQRDRTGWNSFDVDEVYACRIASS
ncbi:hypothetical protein FIBSPDRAFT_863742 [Athelia psychrophila]|uniref:Uncharacterized protein n=1 Tax=Athelia psychrophila TaxID=1759441 RepID=A0A166H532_9AGAM|nr:hypothetical protein FIBSPDRAFT_863740 [Fibularhizoctonia sp. CBS 109695]KZP18491.1 hypothetical protein FIBSPDRAFT_863742 [Fibularhizoctonia sp. CBS 109695]